MKESVLAARTLIADGSNDAVDSAHQHGIRFGEVTEKVRKVCALEEITRVSEATPGSLPDTEHLKSLSAAVDVQVPNDIQSQLEDLLIHYRHISSTGPLDMGRTEMMQKCYEDVRTFTGRVAAKQKTRYDLRVRERRFAVGDWVWYWYPRKRARRSPKWSRFYTGPYLIVAVLNNLVYKIQSSKKSQPKVVHVIVIVM